MALNKFKKICIRRRERRDLRRRGAVRRAIRRGRVGTAFGRRLLLLIFVSSDSQCFLMLMDLACLLRLIFVSSDSQGFLMLMDFELAALLCKCVCSLWGMQVLRILFSFIPKIT